MNFQEIPVIEVLAHILDDSGSSDEGLACRVVHDQIKETLAVALLLIFETIIFCWKLSQARGQKNDLARKDAELALSSLLRVSTTWIAYDTNPVTAAQKTVEGLCSQPMIKSGTTH